MPRDDCFGALGGCSSPRFGDGNWSNGENNYLLTNLGLDDGGNGGTAGDGIPDSMPDMSSYYTAVPAQYTTMRYGLYLAELERLAQRQAQSPPLNSILDRTELGIAQCNTNPAQSGARRRVVIAAGIDCVANPINGAEVDVPVKEFFELFMTEPVGDDGLSPPTLDIWVEVIGSAGGTGFGAAGNGGIFRDVVQIYR